MNNFVKAKCHAIVIQKKCMVCLRVSVIYSVEMDRSAGEKLKLYRTSYLLQFL